MSFVTDPVLGTAMNVQVRLDDHTKIAFEYDFEGCPSTLTSNSGLRLTIRCPQNCNGSSAGDCSGCNK